MDNISGRFSLEEKKAVYERTLYGGGGNEGATNYNPDFIGGENIKKTYIWPLSYKEASNLNENLRKAQVTWWLRTPGHTGRAALVGDDGTLFMKGWFVNNIYGIRPAFCLDQSKVLFTSAANDGKVSVVGSSALTPVR